MIQLFDTLPLNGVRLNGDGYLVADVRAGRTGIQEYLGAEVGCPDKAIVRVYRPESEVFKDAAMASFTTIPVTMDHPPELVSPKNWKRYAVGFTGEGVARDGGFLRVPLAIKDADAIDAVTNGKRELSFGYTCDLDFTSGTTPEGETYDAVQRNLRGNHLAVVSQGRAGSECRIGDEKRSTPSMKTIQVDGIPVEVTDAGATVIDTLQKRLAAATADGIKATTDAAAAVAARDKVIADKDRELGTKDGQIAKLTADLAAATLDADKLDAMVAERADVLAKASTIAADVDFKGKDAKAVRRLAVAKKLGDATVANKSDDYVEALFDSCVGSTDATRDPLADAFRSGGATTQTVDAKAEHRKMIDHMQGAWQNPQGRAA